MITASFQLEHAVLRKVVSDVTGSISMDGGTLALDIRFTKVAIDQPNDIGVQLEVRVIGRDQVSNEQIFTVEVIYLGVFRASESVVFDNSEQEYEVLTDLASRLMPVSREFIVDLLRRIGANVVKLPWGFAGLPVKAPENIDTGKKKRRSSAKAKS